MIEIYAINEVNGTVIGIEIEKNSDVIKLPPLANGWHYEIENLK